MTYAEQLKQETRITIKDALLIGLLCTAGKGLVKNWNFDGFTIEELDALRDKMSKFIAIESMQSLAPIEPNDE